MAREIQKIIPTEEANFQAKPSFYPLGITSMKTAIFLNYLISMKLDSCRGKLRSWYSRDEADGKVGGGLLVKADPRITINDLNEVGINFRNEWKVSSFIRVANSKSEMVSSIMDKIGNEIKKLWKVNLIMEERRGVKAEENAKLFIPIKDYTRTSESTYSKEVYLELDPTMKVESKENGDQILIIDYNEYRAIYEYFKGRDKDKIISRYGQVAFDTMVGKKIEDQFLLSAIDVIRGEIKQATDEYAAIKKSLSEQEQAEINEIKAKYHNLLVEADARKAAKLSELQTNMKQMTAMAVAAV